MSTSNIGFEREPMDVKCHRCPLFEHVNLETLAQLLDSSNARSLYDDSLIRPNETEKDLLISQFISGINQ